jgi:hypothetical protein
VAGRQVTCLDRGATPKRTRMRAWTCFGRRSTMVRADPALPAVCSCSCGVMQARPSRTSRRTSEPIFACMTPSVTRGAIGVRFVIAGQ